MRRIARSHLVVAPNCWLRRKQSMAKQPSRWRLRSRALRADELSRLPPGGGGQFLFAFAREHHDEARGFRGVHGGIVDQDGVGGAHQRRNFAFAMGLVALANFLEGLARRNAFSFFLMLFPTAPV